MPREISSGAVIFRHEREIKYLLLHYESGHWDFPRGHIEKGEAEKDTATREIEEETGISDLIFIPGFREKTFWFFKKEGKTIYKEAILYLAETKTADIKLSFEHIGFEWLSYKEALEQLTFDNSKKILQKAHNFLIKNKNYLAHL